MAINKRSFPRLNYTILYIITVLKVVPTYISYNLIYNYYLNKVRYFSCACDNLPR